MSAYVSSRDDEPFDALGDGSGLGTLFEPLSVDGDLPRSYGRSRVVLLPVDPHVLHVYWEITAQDREQAVARLGGKSAPWVVRLHDVTCVDFDGSNAHGHFDVEVELEQRSHYVQLWAPNKSYFAELGARLGSTFVPVCRSQAAHVPRADPAPPEAPTWVETPGQKRADSRALGVLSPHAASAASKPAISTAASAPVAAPPASSVRPEPWPPAFAAPRAVSPAGEPSFRAQANAPKASGASGGSGPDRPPVTAQRTTSTRAESSKHLDGHESESPHPALPIALRSTSSSLLDDSATGSGGRWTGEGDA